VHAELRLGAGVCVSCKRVARLMRELGIEGVSCRRGKVNDDPGRERSPCPRSCPR